MRVDLEELRLLIWLTALDRVLTKEVELSWVIGVNDEELRQIVTSGSGCGQSVRARTDACEVPLNRKIREVRGSRKFEEMNLAGVVDAYLERDVVVLLAVDGAVLFEIEGLKRQVGRHWLGGHSVQGKEVLHLASLWLQAH